MPEVLWKTYIDFEVDQEEYDNTRMLYRRLLERTHHVKVRAVICSRWGQQHLLDHPCYLYLVISSFSFSGRGLSEEHVKKNMKKVPLFENVLYMKCNSCWMMDLFWELKNRGGRGNIWAELPPSQQSMMSRILATLTACLVCRDLFPLYISVLVLHILCFTADCNTQIIWTSAAWLAF